MTYDEIKEEPAKQEISELDRLKQELKDAIKDQRFEDAASLRDRINDMTEGKNE